MCVCACVMLLILILFHCVVKSTTQQLKTVVLWVFWTLALVHHRTTYTHARTHARTHTHTHPFNGPFSGTTQVSRYQKGKTNLHFIEAKDSE